MAEVEATLTPVLNNRESLVQLQLSSKKTTVGAQPGPFINLIPGMNFVDTALWEEAKKNAVVVAMLIDLIPQSRAQEQNPERVGKPYLVESKPVSKDNPLKSMSQSNAVLAVGEMFDVRTMKRFMDQEERPQIINALKAQINKIENPKIEKKVS